MATRTCSECTTVFAVGVRKCPQCGSTKGFETGGKDDPGVQPPAESPDQGTELPVANSEGDSR